MKIRIIKEIYKKKNCEKKTGESGNCEVTTSRGKSCYDSCEEAAAAVESPKNEEQLDEISASSAVVGAPGAGGGSWPQNQKDIEDFNEKEKKQSELDEMYSTGGHFGGRTKVSHPDEFDGYLERAKYQNLQNTKPTKRRFKIRFKR